MSLEKVLQLMKMNTHVTFFCKYGLSKNFLTPCYYGHQIAVPRVSTKTEVDCKLTNQCSCLEFLTAIKWEIELKVKLACGVGKQNF